MNKEEEEESTAEDDDDDEEDDDDVDTLSPRPHLSSFNVQSVSVSRPKNL